MSLFNANNYNENAESGASYMITNGEKSHPFVQAKRDALIQSKRINADISANYSLGFPETTEGLQTNAMAVLYNRLSLMLERMHHANALLTAFLMRMGGTTYADECPKTSYNACANTNTNTYGILGAMDDILGQFQDVINDHIVAADKLNRLG